MIINGIVWIFFIFLEFILTLRFCEKVYERKNIRRFSWLLLFSLIFCNYLTIIRFGINYVLLIEITLLTATLAIPLLIEPKNYRRNVFISVIYSTGMFLVSNLSVFVWITLFDIPINNFILFIIIETLKSMYIFMLIDVASQINNIPDRILFLITLLCFVIRALVLILMVFTNRYSESLGYTLLFIALTLFMVYLLIMMIIFKFSSYLEKYSVNSFENDKLKYLAQYSDIALSAFEDVKVWNHDLKNHMSVILSLLESQSEDEVRKYINELNIETSKLENVLYTNNIILDCLLDTKINYANKQDIKVNLDINFKQPLSMHELDIVTLMSNLLDNAIESCERIPNNRWINIYLKTEKNKFIIKIKNPTDGNLGKSIFKTRKKSGTHGIGLLQIDKVVAKYKGHVERVHNNNIFSTTILLINKSL